METGYFFQVPVNYTAVLLSAVLNMLLGFLWYGPLFGKKWMALSGWTKEKMEKAKKDMSTTYAIMFLSSIVMAWILFHFIWYAAPANYTLFISIKVAIYAWIGFIATYALSKMLYSPAQKSYTLYLIDTGYYLAALVLMAVVIFLLK